MYGININCKEIEFVEMILNNEKIAETRNRNTLKKLIGERVGIIETGKGKATLKGYATIDKCVKVTDLNEFRQLYNAHLVSPGSKYDFKKVKYLYYLSNIEKCEDRIINSFGISYREI